MTNGDLENRVGFSVLVLCKDWLTIRTSEVSC